MVYVMYHDVTKFESLRLTYFQNSLSTNLMQKVCKNKQDSTFEVL